MPPTPARTPKPLFFKNVRLLVLLCLLGITMLGLAYAFVPFYRTFCQFLGIPVPSISVGQQGSAPTSAPTDPLSAQAEPRLITVRFMGNQANNLPVTLQPVHKKIRLRLGESVLTAYTAQNTSSQAIDGVAVHTIVGLGSANADDMSSHVTLQQCFCFEEQHYPAGQEITLPLSFSVDHTLPEGVHTLTFAYTLFEQEKTQKAELKSPIKISQ